MVRSLPVALLECVLLAVPLAGAQIQQPIAETVSPSSGFPVIPPLPPGKTTVMGGTIRNLDLVRDQFSLAPSGEKPMKILFDERTQVFRDGVRIPLRELQPEGHASVQTTLEGTNVFAVSIHILSAFPEGECRGRVLSYNPRTGELAVSSTLSPQPIKLLVPADAPIEREGQPAFASQSRGRSDLVAGALVNATFRHGQNSKDTASRIAILAVPGAAFSFAGKISYLDLSKGLLELVDSNDGKSYELHFPVAHMPANGKANLGDIVTVKAYYDGTQYQASEITAR